MKESRIVNGFHHHVDISEKHCAGAPLASPGKAVINHLVVAADGDMDPKDGPGDKWARWLDGRHHNRMLLESGVLLRIWPRSTQIRCQPQLDTPALIADGCG